MRVQLELRAIGYFCGSIDGSMTDELRNSIRAFQLVQKLPETGKMDDATFSLRHCVLTFTA